MIKDDIPNSRVDRISVNFPSSFMELVGEGVMAERILQFVRMHTLLLIFVSSIGKKIGLELELNVFYKVSADVYA